jgi:hypothetical protein
MAWEVKMAYSFLNEIIIYPKMVIIKEKTKNEVWKTNNGGLWFTTFSTINFMKSKHCNCLTTHVDLMFGCTCKSLKS